MFKFCPPKVLPDLESKTFEDGKRYYVTPAGNKLPSVTTVVGAKKKEFFKAWRNKVGEDVANAITKKATSRGTNLHNICEQYLKGESINWKSLMPDALEMFQSISEHIQKINNIHYIEQALWSEQLGLAGRVDVIAEYDGVLSIIDFKTSKRPKNLEDIQDYFWQTCAYALMYEEHVGEPINQLVIIMAVENDVPLIYVQKTEDHINGLVEAIAFYKEQK